MSMKLIIPGLNGSGDGHWQNHWLQDDPDAVLVEQRDWHRPNLHEWTERVEKALARHPGSILIAHSIGAIVVAGLGLRSARHLVKGALLVAPCDLGLVQSLHPGALQSSQTLPFKQLPFPSTVVASRDDPYMSFEGAAALAETLGSELVDLGRAGHINIASGYGRWKKGYRLAARLERHTYVRGRFRKPSLLDSLLRFGA